MGNSRCVVVLCLPRTGSSALAGALERLGVPMGRDTWRDGMNPRGYYEDRRWHRLHTYVTGVRYDVKTPKGLAERHRKAYEKLVVGLNRQPVWGFKDPRTCMVFPHIADLLEDTRVVVVTRDREETALSLKRHSERAYGGQFRMDEEHALAKVDEWQAALDWSLEWWDGPTLEVQYRGLLDDTEATVRALAEFCFKGLPFTPDEERIEAACRWVDPELAHFGRSAEDETEEETEPLEEDSEEDEA